jgi:hypothetical protein
MGCLQERRVRDRPAPALSELAVTECNNQFLSKPANPQFERFVRSFWHPLSIVFHESKSAGAGNDLSCGAGLRQLLISRHTKPAIVARESRELATRFTSSRDPAGCEPMFGPSTEMPSPAKQSSALRARPLPDTRSHPSLGPVVADVPSMAAEEVVPTAARPPEWPDAHPLGAAVTASVGRAPASRCARTTPASPAGRRFVRRCVVGAGRLIEI